MAKSTPLFVGLDVRKDSIAVAHAAGGHADPPVFVMIERTVHPRPPWSPHAYRREARRCLRQPQHGQKYRARACRTPDAIAPTDVVTRLQDRAAPLISRISERRGVAAVRW
jgi:hypothetical protein